jgi:poly-beta-1,6-N-acetyl-D-glucosamine synthase
MSNGIVKETYSNRYDSSYVLMTAAYNEEAFIEKTLSSVVSQTVLPRRWVIVSDGSTDKTDELVKRYTKQYDFIRLLRVTRPVGRSFGAKVMALQTGSTLLNDLAFKFIGNIDADISVEPSYFEGLMHSFDRRPRLGLAAGLVYEEKAGQFHSRRSNRRDSVSHSAQLLRRECYEAIGGYAVLKYGGEDWYAQVSAKMKGWEAETLPSLIIFHNRHTGTAANVMRDRFRLGRLDYSFGSDPVFEVLKCLQRLPENPVVIGGVARLAGFVWSYLCRDIRPVPADFIVFLRNEQRSKLFSLFKNGAHEGVIPVRPHSREF